MLQRDFDFLAMGDVVRAVDRPDFYECLAHALQPITSASGVSAYLLHRGAAPTMRVQTISEVSLLSRSVPTTAYVDWAYKTDPLVAAFESGEPAGGYSLKEIKPSNFANCSFYKDFYEKAFAKDEVAVLAPLTEETAIAVYFVRGMNAAYYSDDDIAVFKDFAPTIIESIRLHEARATRRVEPAAFAHQWAMALDTIGTSVLSRREREVLRLTLEGRTARETAQILKISEGTAKNHRKKIYRRLDVATLGELMTLFRHAASYANGRDDPLEICPNSVRFRRFP